MRGTQFEIMQWGIGWRLIVIAAMILALIGAVFTAAVPSKSSALESGDYWVYKATYDGTITHWTETYAGDETKDSVPSYKTEITYDVLPQARLRTMPFITITIQEPGYTWRSTSEKDYVHRYQEANASIGGLAQNELYYENYSGAHGLPLSFGKTWSYDVRIVSSNPLGNSTNSFTAVVADSLESVTVPLGTFDCYKVTHTHTGSGTTIVEWWDSTGTFDVAPIKTVDTYNFAATSTQELEECSFCQAGPTTYTLDTASGAGGSVTDPGEGSFGPYDAGDIVNLVATPEAGFTFDEWTGDTGDIADVNAASTTITMNDNYSVTANFVAVAEEYELTTASGDNGSVTTPGEGTFGPYTAGESVDLVATPDAGYMFDGWTGDTGTIADVNAATTTITMNDDYSVTATFTELVTYNLNIASGDNGSVTTPGEGAFGPYDGGSMVDLVATPDAGFMFDGWTGDTEGIADTSAASTTITMNGDYSITANFTELVQYELTTANSGNGSVTTPGEGIFAYDAGSVVNLVATPDAGYVFDRWTGDVGDVADPFSASTTITMNADASVTADFTEAPEQPASWDCPLAEQALIAPYAANGRPELSGTVELSSIDFDMDWFMVFWLDEDSGAWYTYYSGFTHGNTLTQLEPGKYYYVVVSDPGSLSLS